LPPGKHSVMGIGRTRPNPEESIQVMDNVEVPLGKPIPSNFQDTKLLYNEYPFLCLIESLYKICMFPNILLLLMFHWK